MVRSTARRCKPPKRCNPRAWRRKPGVWMARRHGHKTARSGAARGARGVMGKDARQRHLASHRAANLALADHPVEPAPAGRMSVLPVSHRALRPLQSARKVRDASHALDRSGAMASMITPRRIVGKAFDEMPYRAQPELGPVKSLSGRVRADHPYPHRHTSAFRSGRCAGTANREAARNTESDVAKRRRRCERLIHGGTIHPLRVVRGLRGFTVPFEGRMIAGRRDVVTLEGSLADPARPSNGLEDDDSVGRGRTQATYQPLSISATCEDDGSLMRCYVDGYRANRASIRSTAIPAPCHAPSRRTNPAIRTCSGRSLKACHAAHRTIDGGADCVRTLAPEQPPDRVDLPHTLEPGRRSGWRWSDTYPIKSGVLVRPSASA